MITTDKTKNKDFKKAADNALRLAEYLLYGINYKKENEKKRILYKGTFNCAGDDISEAATQIKLLNERYNATATARSKNRLRTHHLIISLNVGEHLAFEQWVDVAKQHLKTLNLDEHLALWAVHKDTDNEHMHLVFSDVNPQTLKINNLSNERRKLQVLDVKLEDRYLIKKDNHSLTHLGDEAKALDLEAKTAQQSFFTYINEFKDELDKSNTWQEFFQILNEYGVKLEKLGRGIVFITQDPEDQEKTVYVKGSAFNSNGFSMSLHALEKRFGTYNVEFNQFYNERIKKRYQAIPVNFKDDQDQDILNLSEFGYSLNEAFEEYHRYKEIEKKNNAELEKRLKNLDYEFHRILKQESKQFTHQKQLITQAYHLNDFEMKEQINKATVDFQKKKEYLKSRKKQIEEKLKDLFKTKKINSTNFLEYLKTGVLVGVKKERNLLLLLSRKESRKQNHRNYVQGPRVRIVSEDSIADTMMHVRNEKNFYVHKVTGKGQLILYGSKRSNAGDFIKDDGLKLMCNEHPTTITVKTVTELCKQCFEKDRKILCHGTPEFQRQFLEFSLKKDFNITFYGNEELNKEYDRRREEHQHNAGNRKKLREYSRQLRDKRYRTLRKTVNLLRGRAKSVASIRRFRITEENFTKSENNQQQYSITNGNIFPNTESFNGSRRNQQNDANSQSSMRNLHKLSMAAEQQSSSMLLSNDKRDSMGEHTSREVLHRMRWKIPGERGREQLAGSENLEQNYRNDTVLDLLNRFGEDHKEGQKDLISSSPPDETKSSVPDAVIKYVNERNEKHSHGFKDVLEHHIYSNQTGDFIFRGLRELSNKYYALLEQNQTVYIKQVDAYALSRLKNTKRGVQIRIDKTGKIINRNRNKEYKR